MPQTFSAAAPKARRRRDRATAISLVTTLLAILAIAIAFNIGPISRAFAGDALCPKCAHCGRAAECQKTCRLVCEEKKVTIVCWGSKKEDFCIPGPSRPGCQQTEWVCDEEDPQAPCAQAKKFVWTDWIPSCDARLHTRTKLMKKTVAKKIPSYKWVVEDLCAECEKQLEVAEIPPDVAVPLPPVVAASEPR